MSIDLPTVWAMLLALAVLMYVLLDGFDLGIGILFPFLGEEHNRGIAMNSVAPVWDGNETWLVLGGGGLYAVFPLAYATMLPALYAPIIAMLLGLVFRGVAFEFYWRTHRAKFLWDWAFTLGSVMAALAQGIALGALVQGINVVDRSYAGGWWDWLTPFSLVTGVALVFGYGLLGATWLIMKTDGDLQKKAYQLAWPTGLVTFFAIGLISFWVLFLDPAYMARWFCWPAILYVIPVPLLVAVCGRWLFRSLEARREIAPFIASICLFVLCYIGLIISFFPNIVPPSITIWDAAGPDKSLSFLLVGTVALLPIILGYTAYAYWVFRGKVDPNAGYH